MAWVAYSFEAEILPGERMVETVCIDPDTADPGMAQEKRLCP